MATVRPFLRRHITHYCVLILAISALAATAFAQTTAKPFVSPIFGDNMVLQRGKVNTFWGWSEPGDKVQVQIANRTGSGVAAANGRWEVKMMPPAVGGPYEVKIQGKQTVELQNVLVGDVWICSGQSNMAFGLSQAKNGAEDVKAANFPNIRFFVVPERSTYSEQDVIQASSGAGPMGRRPAPSWRAVSPQTAGGFGGISAAAFYFARKLQSSINVPIGLVQAAVGGVPAESWTSPEALRKVQDFDPMLDEMARLRTRGGQEYGNFVMHWYDEFDQGQKQGSSWAAPDLDDSSWKTVHIPGAFAELGVPDTPSLAYFRKEIVLPDPVPSGGRLYLGMIERMDTVYINGQSAGGSSWVENPRVYFMRNLKPGRNVITIRVLKVKPDGGFLSKPEDLKLVFGDGTVIPMAGEWKGKLSVDARPPHALPLAYENWPIMPSVLYNGMLKPIAPLAITGAIWYQGEQNSNRAYQYRKVLPTMIGDWRRLFGQGDFPFYIVSLPAYQPRKDTPGTDDWAELREAQAMTARTVPHTCLAVTIDTGDANNIHPTEKVPAGERLALCAMAEHYGKKVVFSGPTLKSVKPMDGALKLQFDHADGGLVVKGDKLGEFAVAGDDQKWYWADAKIEGKTVIVSSKSVPNPKHVRYAWQSNPVATLFNGAGLPAVPFRTDQWPGVTEGKK